MAEEHRCQAPRLCANSCGFFGSPATQNLCSKCYCDLQLKEQSKLALNQTLAASSSTSMPSSSSSASIFVSAPTVDLAQAGRNRTAVMVEGAEKEAVAAGVQPNRCNQCRKRVGLTGFKCRCGMVFCGSHRYPEQHSCGFDFKSVGKQQIAKANPVVKAEKLQKI